MTRFIIFFIILTSYISTALARPSIAILQSSLKIEGRKRSASLTVTNSGNEGTFVKAQFFNMIMLRSGNLKLLEELTEEEKPKDYLQIQKFIRLSPKRFYIDANSSQVIRVFFRKPPDLKDGEYVVHLAFIPEEERKEETAEDKENNKKAKGIGVKINISMEMRIPVIIKHGTISENISFVKESLSLKDAFTKKGNKKHNKKTFNMLIKHEGNESTTGLVALKYIDSKGQHFTLNETGLKIYAYLPERMFKIEFDIPDSEDFKNNIGSFEASYRNLDEDEPTIVENFDFSQITQ